MRSTANVTPSPPNALALPYFSATATRTPRPTPSQALRHGANETRRKDAAPKDPNEEGLKHWLGWVAVFSGLGAFLFGKLASMGANVMGKPSVKPQTLEDAARLKQHNQLFHRYAESLWEQNKSNPELQKEMTQYFQDTLKNPKNAAYLLGHEVTLKPLPPKVKQGLVTSAIALGAVVGAAEGALLGIVPALLASENQTLRNQTNPSNKKDLP
jgi:hypothetical protein